VSLQRTVAERSRRAIDTSDLQYIESYFTVMNIQKRSVIEISVAEVNRFTRIGRSLGVLTLAAILFECCVQSGSVPRAFASIAPKDDTKLFKVTDQLSFGSYGPGANIVASDRQAIFLTGTFERVNNAPASDLIRVDSQTLVVTARARLPTVTSVAIGDGALWWATGAPLGNAGTTDTPGHGRMLFKVNPTNLKILARFVLPDPTLLVTAAQGKIWVATSTDLFRINPETGAIITRVALGFFPTALAPSYDGTRLYVLGYLPKDHMIFADYSATSGQRLGSRQYPNFSGGPLAVVRGGVWIPVQSTTTQSTTIRLFTGRRFTSSSSLGKFTFDTEAYVEGNVLWLIDSGGEGPTVCANPVDGKIRAEGSPVGVEYGAMTFDAGSTYILRTNASNQSLLKINPSSTCSR
jgi:DNA-binding beta-propeller fold protein YncE